MRRLAIMAGLVMLAIAAVLAGLNGGPPAMAGASATARSASMGILPSLGEIAVGFSQGDHPRLIPPP